MSSSLRVILPFYVLKGAALRRGFSLVELLVALGVASIVLALVLPSVHSAREAARRVQCTNNLRQLGIASESVHAAQGRYAKYIHWDTPVMLSGHAELVPYLDRAELLLSIDLNDSGTPASEPPNSSANARMMSQAVTAFICPTDNVPLGGNSYRACFGATSGIFATWTPRMPRIADPSKESITGVFCGAQNVRDVRDGLSQTALFSERLVGDQRIQSFDPVKDVAHLARFDVLKPDSVAEMCSRTPAITSHFSYSGSTWLLGHYPQTAYNHILTPNSSIPDCVSDKSYDGRSLGDGAHTARSYHPGGVNVCMADGAVRFVSENIDLKVWRAIGTIHGGEIVQEF